MRILITNTDKEHLYIVDNENDIVDKLKGVRDYFILNNPYDIFLDTPLLGYKEYKDNLKDCKSFINLFHILKNNERYSRNEFYCFLGYLLTNYASYQLSKSHLKDIFITVHDTIDSNPEFWYAVKKFIKKNYPNEDWSAFEGILTDFTKRSFVNMEIRTNNISECMEHLNFYNEEAVKILHTEN